MPFVQRTAGLVAILLGCVGVLVSAAGLVAVWRVKVAADRGVRQVETRVDAGLAAVEDKTHEINSWLDYARGGVEQLNSEIQQHIASGREIPAAEASQIAELEHQLETRLQLAKEWLDVARAGVELFAQLKLTANSARLLTKTESQNLAELSDAIKIAGQELELALQLADEFRDQLKAVRVGPESGKIGPKVAAMAERLGRPLNRLRELGRDFEGYTQQCRADVGLISQRVQRRVAWVAITCSGLLLWSAAAQACLLYVGSGWFRRRQIPGDNEATDPPKQ